MTESGYAPGRVVVERDMYVGKGSRRRKVVAWTLHEEDCSQARRARALPAPATPYPNTVDCVYCAPTGEHRRSAPVEQPDGTWQQRCRCELVATGASFHAARNKLFRMHRGDRPASAADSKRDQAHKVTIVEAPDGGADAKCACGASVWGPNGNAARVRLYRAHRRSVLQADREAS